MELVNILIGGVDESGRERKNFRREVQSSVLWLSQVYQSPRRTISI